MDSECNFYVFREGRRSVAAEQLLAGLRESAAGAADANGWIDALLRAGELECGLEDAGSEEAGRIAQITDGCAEKLVSERYQGGEALVQELPPRLNGELKVSTPEGFAYYALHPRQYAAVVERLGEVRRAVVVGIRSIGTTLSAMTTAALRARGARAERITVRPVGDPFERQVHWDGQQQNVIRTGRHDGALFVVVDEGPGLSGSSFLSVAESLCAMGVAADCIVLVPSYVPDPPRLIARDAQARWKCFRCVPVEDGDYPAGEWLGCGEWRAHFFPDVRAWPGAWTNMERAKRLSPDGRVIWKFEGLGPYGQRALGQAKALAAAGYGPAVVRMQDGYIGYERLPGALARVGQSHAEQVTRLAEYCAFRTKHFGCEVTTAQEQDLATMVRVNFEREFGVELPEAMAELEWVKPVVCDAKMEPHEWLCLPDGSLLKLDATAHGDGHFFPGPCDIAWDLAGAIVEWQMEGETRADFLRAYSAASEDRKLVRVENYILAYAVFRLAWSRMAARAVEERAEQDRLLREYRRYRAYAERVVAASAR